jgi:hypothetical protein
MLYVVVLEGLKEALSEVDGDAIGNVHVSAPDHVEHVAES